MVNKICECCGNEFIAKRSDARFCSDKCRKKFKRAEQKQTVKIVCIICGNEFVQRHGNQQYCSDECSETARILDQMHNNTRRNEIYSFNDGSWED